MKNIFLSEKNYMYFQMKITTTNSIITHPQLYPKAKSYFIHSNVLCFNFTLRKSSISSIKYNTYFCSVFTEQQNFRPLQNESINFADNKNCYSKTEIWFGKVKKDNSEKEEILVTSIIFFSQNVFKRLLPLRLLKSLDCIVKS